MRSLIFGCGRLTGGPTYGTSANLISACLDQGIRHFDVAPSYGIGTAEAVLGKILGGRADVAITTKVGSRPPAMAVPKAYLRYVKRTLGFSRRNNAAGYSPGSLSAHDPAEFAAERMSASFRASLARLRRSRIDRLLLHEVQAETIDGTMLEFLSLAQAQGSCAHIGYSNSSFYTPSSLAPSLQAQCALPADILFVPAADFERAVTFHSVLRVIAWAQERHPELAVALSQTSEQFASLRLPEARTVLAYTLAMQSAPSASFVYATTDLDRLLGFLAGLRRVDELGIGPAIASAFRARLTSISGGARATQAAHG